MLTEAIRQTLDRPSIKPRIFLQSAADWKNSAGQPEWQRPDQFLVNVPSGAEIIEIDTQPPNVGAAVLEMPGKGIESAPLVTAIVSTYNSEKFMRRCLDDLEAQTISRNMEILIIDSGSEQNERSIVEEYQRRYDNIRYVRTERETLYASWNRAVRLARGKYVANANTDDSRRNDALEILCKALEAHPEAGLAYGNYGMTNKPNDTFPSQNVYQEVVHDPYHPAQVLFYCPTGCLQFWRKSALEELKCFNDTYKCVGDYEILIRFMRAGFRAVLVPEFLSLFYINQQGLSFGSGTAAKEDQDTKARYRQEVTADEVFDIDSSNPRELASAWIALGNLAASVRVPWSDTPHRFEDYSISCYNNAMKADPNEPSAWHNVAVIAHRLGICDLVLKKFSKTIPDISSILEGAKRDLRLRGYPVRPRVEGLVYDRRLPSMFAVETQKASMAAKFSGTKSRALVPLASKAPYDIAWEGSFLGQGSLAHVNRELMSQLSLHSDFALTRVERGTLDNRSSKMLEFQELSTPIKPRAAKRAQITIRHAWPPNWHETCRGILVVIQPWEYGALPKAWVAQAKQVTQFWVPTNHVRQVYIASGIPESKVKVVPNGIDPGKFFPEVQPMALATRKSFKFLFVGGTIHRKGPDVLLEGYLRSFTAQDDVCLVIKDFGGQSFYAGQTIEARIKAAQSLPNAPEILYLNTELPPEVLPGLYTACDCLVHPYRGEGFGLPIIEAMACGLPVIVTAGGAADDFATTGLAYHIPAQRRSIGREVSGMPLVGEGWLLEPSVKETAARMRHVFGHREEARAKGQAASHAVRRDWTWERAAALAHQHLQTLVADTGAAAAKVSPPPTCSKAAPIVLPPCALIGHLAGGRTQLGNKKYRAAWEFTLSAIRARPYHPEAYLLLAEMALASGDSSSARRCAQHARLLAPDWKPAKRFLKSNLRGNARPDWLVLPASRATRLSVCLIVKDEEQFLGQCLASVRGLADQIVIVDTGSTDRTVAIAKEHGAEVHDFVWCDDFSAARNAALEHATGDWILMLDADEELPSESHNALRKLMAEPSVMAWRLPIIDVGREDEGCCYVPRLFRNAPALFYIGRVHEQVFTSIEVRRQEWGLDNRLGNATLRHHGYRPEIVKDRNKIERNLRLLEKAIVELPDEPNLMMNYGLELVRSGQVDIGMDQYRKAFDLMSAQPPSLMVPETREMLLTQFYTHLIALRRFDEIIQVLTSPLAQSGGLTASLHFALGLAHLELKQSREAADQMRQCLAKRSQPSLAPINPEIHKAGPHHCLALCLSQLGNMDAAAEEFLLAIKDDPQSRPARLDYARLLAASDRPVDALNLLFELANQKADDPAVWVLGGQTALSRPEFLEVALDWTAEASQHLPQDPTILRHRAEALTLANRCEEALPLWRKLRPESDLALAAVLVLCELVANDTQYSPPAHLEAQVSQEFLNWYQRVIRFNGRPTIEAVNARIDLLKSRLPTVAHMLQQALVQARVAAAA